MVRGEQALSRWSLRQLIWICLGSIVAVFFVTASTSIIAGSAVSRAMDQLDDHTLPPRKWVAALSKAYVDQETGQRGFLLTGQQASLGPYFAGKIASDRLITELDSALAGDGEARRRLNAVVSAADDWLTKAAEPQIALRRSGLVPPDQLAAMTMTGMGLFDQLRVRLSALDVRVDELIDGQVARVRTAQLVANTAGVAVAVLLLAGVIVSDWLLRRMLTRPVASMLADVTAVAGGAYDRSISSAGLREVAELATATETMRQSLRRLLIEKERADSQRADAEVRYRILADNAVDVIAHLRGREVVWVSRSAETAFGWPLEQWIGSDFSSRIHPDDLDVVRAALQEAATENSVAARCRVYTADGGYRWVEFNSKPYIDAEDNADGAITAVRIIDDHVAAELQLKADKERFEAVVANAPSAISVRDLEHRYTQVNEAFCQLFGQRSVADVIGRTEDEILSAEALERARLSEARLLAGESLVEEEVITSGREDISVMTQRFPLRDSGGAISELVTIRTDVTQRKKGEREAAERARWEARIWAAIGEGRLLVYSQPIVDIATRDPVAEELLVRLVNEENEQILPPSEFLPQCEQYGLIPIIDRFMVGCAIDLAHAGREVSVNITGQTIGDRTAMSEILAALTTAGPDAAGKINFEITETTALASPGVAKVFSAGMRDLGCRVALDDFGTGYGTFTELRNLQLDTLKIDQSFVQNILEDREDERIVKTIVFVARQYELSTVAEGVETAATLERLAALGVDRAQGFLLSKPKPIVW